MYIFYINKQFDLIWFDLCKTCLDLMMFRNMIMSHFQLNCPSSFFQVKPYLNSLTNFFTDMRISSLKSKFSQLSCHIYFSMSKRNRFRATKRQMWQNMLKMANSCYPFFSLKSIKCKKMSKIWLYFRKYGLFYSEIKYAFKIKFTWYDSFLGLGSVGHFSK